MTGSNVSEIRKAVVEAIPYTMVNLGESPDPRYVYMSFSHEKALRLGTNLVIGESGAGKSFLTAALKDKNICARLGKSIPELKNTSVYVGFSARDDIAAYPDKDTFTRLFEQGFVAYEIWRAVASRWVSEVAHFEIPRGDWSETVGWVKENPEQVTKLFQSANAVFESKDRRGLILFDALEGCNDNWEKMNGIVRDLMRVVLWLKSYSRISGKVFLRTDQFSSKIMDFTDSSKLFVTMVELTWRVHDLHGLLWQLLCNAPGKHGAVLRTLYEGILGQLPEQTGNSEKDTVWLLTDREKHAREEQRNLFEILAGPYMGTNKRQGVPYAWIVSHLADSGEHVSPRSFLAAIRSAAEDSLERFPDHQYPLHYESIKRGIRDASFVRIGEVTEDYPWVADLLNLLEGMSVPCEFLLIEERWNKAFPAGVETLPRKDCVSPESLKKGWVGICKKLERMGIFQRLQGGEINMPDLYRIGFKLGGTGRKGMKNGK
jgi:hypothetical protein